MPDFGYESIDVGDGRRLERFGEVVVDRPAPAATEPQRDRAAWRRAAATFGDDGSGGAWSFSGPLPDPWRLRLASLELELRPAGGGQVGVFPEQHAIWAEAAERIREMRANRPVADQSDPGSPRMLSLFAYTGAATLACARAGGTVVHIDASRTAVSWARRNAELSGLAAAPIRWIVEDAATFAAREARRGRRYDVIVLDPPSYGHGRAGRAWQIERDLEPLLETLRAVLASPGFVALTAHTPDYTPERLGCLLGAFGRGTVRTGSLQLVASSGARLRLGSWATWSGA